MTAVINIQAHDGVASALFTPCQMKRCNECSRVLLFCLQSESSSIFLSLTTQPPPWDIFSRYLKKKTLWPWWTLWCPVSLILLTGQQTTSKPGLFSHQTNTHTFSLVDVEWWIFQPCCNRIYSYMLHGKDGVSEFQPRLPILYFASLHKSIHLQYSLYI